MKKQKLTYEVVLEPSDEGGFTVYVPSLRGCVSEGDTEEESLDAAHIKDAIMTWLDSWEQIAGGVTSPVSSSSRDQSALG